MKYASETTVPVEKSRAEIEACVQRYGATSFASGWQNNSAAIGFSMKGREIRFILPLPDRKDKKFTNFLKRGSTFEYRRSDDAALKEWEQACRQRWRALLLAIKAKLEAVECAISTFDSEFLANIVQPNGMTIGESLLPQIADMVSSGRAPSLFLPPPAV